MGALLTLTEGIDFGARDNQPASLLFALIVPEEATEEHLNILASIAALLNEPESCEIIRSATSSNALYKLLISSD